MTVQGFLSWSADLPEGQRGGGAGGSRQAGHGAGDGRCGDRRSAGTDPARGGAVRGNL